MLDRRSVSLGALALSSVFLTLALVVRAEPAAAQQAPSTYGSATASSNNRFLAVTGSVGSGMSVLWLVDTDGKRVLVYGTNSMGKNVELRAARNIEWDLRLDDYMDDSQYKAEDLKRLAERQHATPAAPEKPPASPPGEKDAPPPKSPK